VPTSEVKALWDKIAFSRGRDPETIQLAVEETDLLVQAWDGSRLVGTARVITDGAYYATIWDVIVDPEYQGRGIGRALMQRAVEPFLGRGFSFIALFAAEGKESFYEDLGFRPRARAMNLDEARWRAREERDGQTTSH
jgi:GNAT superfamily N-acetyltransferase